MKYEWKEENMSITMSKGKMNEVEPLLVIYIFILSYASYLFLLFSLGGRLKQKPDPKGKPPLQPEPEPEPVKRARSISLIG